jgi:hypothetical protein
MKKIILPSLIAAIVIFIWSFISWTVIGWHMVDIKSLPDESVIEKMDATIKEPGIYIYPGYPTDESDAAMEEWTKKHLAGPLINFMVYYPQGMEPMDPADFIKGFILNFISAFLAAVLLFMTLAQNPSYWRRVTFVVLLAVFAGFMYPFSEWNWWSFPLGYTLVNVADGILTWFFAGLVLAWRIKP